jgi:hypothetical protein
MMSEKELKAVLSEAEKALLDIQKVKILHDVEKCASIEELIRVYTARVDMIERILHPNEKVF